MSAMIRRTHVPTGTGQSVKIWRTFLLAGLLLMSMQAAVLAGKGSPAEKIEDASPRIFDSKTGQELTVARAAEQLARADAVFLGENHDSGPGHQLQLELIQALHQLRPDLVISLEMFERDVQGTLRDYLSGRIDEEQFLQVSRPWSNYADHYRPIVEFARKHRLDVLAANIPRRIASAVAKDEQPDPEDRAWLPRETTAPDDAYAARFRATMQGHGGSLSEEKLALYYQAQCLKDDCMAESMADAFASRPRNWPLVVHLCGRFHSDYGYGTAARLQSRLPLLTLGVVSMEAVEPAELATVDPKAEPLTEARARCHVLVVVPEEPSRKEAKQPVAAPRPPATEASAGG
ncbi:MAG: ChaN family lipoprotein [Planctomycetaceae bacterium]|nr:ChaN family lipoprotein [Planctomycetaceae bacterium]